MLRRVACLLILFSLFITGTRAQPPTQVSRQPRILLLLDGSSSMLQPWSGPEIRFKAAGRIIEGLMDSIYKVNPNVEFGLRVYGHQSPAQNNDCLDSRMEVMFSKNNVTQMGLRLASLRPFGVSPIAYSLRQAAENDLLDDVRNAYSIILITDGGESCGGNICDVVKNLIERKIYFRPYIVSLVEYAPLKEQYACLGSYLQVGKPTDIVPAIRQIVDAYRPILSAPIVGVRDTAIRPAVVKVDTMNKPWPPVIAVVPPVRRVPETTAQLQVRAMRMLKVRPRTYLLSASKRLPLPKPLNLGELFPLEPRPVDKISELKPQQTKPVVVVRTPDPRPVNPGITVPTDRRIDIPMEPRETELLAALRIRPMRVRSNARMTVLSSRPPVALRVPNLELPKFPVEPLPTPVVTVPPRDTARRPPVAVRPAVVDTPRPPKLEYRVIKPEPVKPVAVTKPKLPTQDPMDVKISRDSAKETQLSIYFTDGHGKFYSSTPQLRLVDAVTGKQVKQFHRTVDPNGNPDPQLVPAGTYNLVAVSRSNMVLKKIVIEERMNNKVVVRVNRGSLQFRYDNNPDRPVSEYTAIVNIRFEDGPVNQKQHCSDLAEYPPGNYHVEVNTLPVMQMNLDIDFGSISEIGIPEAGFLQFTNANAIGVVSLLSPLGNQFMRFHSMRLTGNQQSQRVTLLPGSYEVRWLKNPNAPNAKPETLRFYIRSNTETAIEL